jgi:DNA-binding response OmpR family regulator
MISGDGGKPKLKVKNILVVDDEPDMLLIIEEFLEKEGHNVLITNSGKEAIKIIKSRNIQLVLLDVMLPGMDGIVTLREIKKIHPALMIVMITANGNSEKIIDAFNSGAYDYLIKPLDFKYLKEGVIARLEN